MKAEVKFKVGNADYKIQFDDAKEMELMHKMIVLGNPPSYCTECKNGQYFRMDANKDKEGNIYVNVVCTKCGAKAKLGQYKTGSYFWHKFEVYQKNEQAKPTATIDLDDTDESVIPF